MKDNSKSVLSIKVTIIILMLIFIVILSLQINNIRLSVIDDNIEINESSYKNQANEEETTRLAKITRTTATITSRSAIDRESNNINEDNKTSITENNVIEDSSEELLEQKKYKSIDEITISKNMDLTISCGISKADFKELLRNTKQDTTDFFYDNSDLIYDLCQKYELNEIFFCGLIAGESGWNIASGHRSTYNYISLMSNGHLIQYSSISEGLETAAKKLHNNYLTLGGCYYSGKTLSAVQKIFCPGSSTWVNLIFTCMSQMVK